MTNTELPEIFIPMFEFDPKRLRVQDPVTNTMDKDGDVVEWTTSKGVYLDEDGNECEPYFELPEQFCFGFNLNHTIGKPKETEYIKGMQVCYSMTSMATIENPTKEEKYAKKVFDALYDLAWKTMKKECGKGKDDRVVPAPTYSSYVAAKQDNDPSSAVKAVYSHKMNEHPKTKKKTVPDLSTPQRTYIKLLTRGSGVDMKPLTIVHGPGDKKVSAFKYQDVRGTIHPVVLWSGFYWGAHGRNPHGCSVQLKLSECNFTPQGDGVPKRRMLGKNAAPVEEDDSSGSDSDGGFPDPRGEEESSEGEDPIKTLQGDGGGSESSEESEEEEEEEEEAPKPKEKKAVKAKPAPKAKPKAKMTAAEKRKRMMEAKKKGKKS